ncbi:MAG: hypothetical protein GYA55_04415 [SAR324 cluster bacterium]|uniref:Uncharacterized protein n=1 Tax=SAR324 cluster bacterium TaxID=2024889 RepID=A0A7X9FQE7_9DELT|nr:hypothetical protein [SAR324 cluster bacterium]
MALSPITPMAITPDRSPIIALGMATLPEGGNYDPAVVTHDSGQRTVIPLRFHTGNLSSIRTQLHKFVDDFMDIVEQSQE